MLRTWWRVTGEEEVLMCRPSSPISDPSRRCAGAAQRQGCARRRRRNGCCVTSTSHLTIATIAGGQPRTALCRLVGADLSTYGQRAFMEDLSRLGYSSDREGTGFAQGPACGLSSAQPHKQPSRSHCPGPDISGASHSPQHRPPAPQSLSWDVAPVHTQPQVWAAPALR